jgi:hypothetical protein
MKTRPTTANIDLRLYLKNSPLEGSQLDEVQRILMQLAPEWASKLHLWRFREPRLTIDVTREGALQGIALSKGVETGNLYRRLAKIAPPTNHRRTGSMELRGAYRGLTVMITLDDWTFCPSGSRWLVGNQIGIQVQRNQIEARDASAWAQECLQHCSSLDPLFGFACTTDEYYAKNISTDGGGLRAIGVDIAKYLPGLYWLNFFGRPYKDLITDARLASAPECEVSARRSGYLLKLSDSPHDWKLPEYRRKEELIRRHLGEGYFFIRDCVQTETVSPFNLPKLPDPRLSIEADVDGGAVINEIRIRERPE